MAQTYQSPRLSFWQPNGNFNWDMLTQIGLGLMSDRDRPLEGLARGLLSYQGYQRDKARYDYEQGVDQSRYQDRIGWQNKVFDREKQEADRNYNRLLTNDQTQNQQWQSEFGLRNSELDWRKREAATDNERAQAELQLRQQEAQDRRAQAAAEQRALEQARARQALMDRLGRIDQANPQRDAVNQATGQRGVYGPDEWGNPVIRLADGSVLNKPGPEWSFEDPMRARAGSGGTRVNDPNPATGLSGQAANADFKARMEGGKQVQTLMKQNEDFERAIQIAEQSPGVVGPTVVNMFGRALATYAGLGPTADVAELDQGTMMQAMQNIVALLSGTGQISDGDRKAVEAAGFDYRRMPPDLLARVMRAQQQINLATIGDHMSYLQGLEGGQQIGPYTDYMTMKAYERQRTQPGPKSGVVNPGGAALSPEDDALINKYLQ